jgi:hypothetical protein
MTTPPQEGDHEDKHPNEREEQAFHQRVITKTMLY